MPGTWAALAAAILLLAPASVRAAAIDLHVHLLMNESVPWLFRGEPTEEPVHIADRKARFKNQVSLKDLEAANVRLVMAALYAPAVIAHLQGGYLQALLRQIGKVEAWAARHPQVSLVRTPEEAEAVLKSKAWRLGVIIAAEGSHGADSTERLNALWDKGLRMLTIAHFVDSPWNGAADVHYWPFPDCRPGGDDPGKRNPKGLSPLGEQLTDHAVAKGLILDLTHSSDKTVEGMVARHPGLPLMFSHEAMRELTPCERTIPREFLHEVRRSRGMVGVTFGANYVGEDLDALVRHARLLTSAGDDAVALGSDYNGFIPRIAGAADSTGYVEVLKRLKASGVPAFKSAEAFVRFWRRTLAYAKKARAG